MIEISLDEYEKSEVLLLGNSEEHVAVTPEDCIVFPSRGCLAIIMAKIMRVVRNL